MFARAEQVDRMAVYLHHFDRVHGVLEESWMSIEIFPEIPHAFRAQRTKFVGQLLPVELDERQGQKMKQIAIAVLAFL